MKYCNKCKTDIAGNLTYCPLCQNELIITDPTPCESVFPETYSGYNTDHLILKILGFISTLVGIVSIFFNMMYPCKIYWSIIVIIALACVWGSLFIAITKHRNLIKYLLYQSIIICIFAVLVDYITGKLGWSITFVLPLTFSLAMIVMYLLSKILHLQAGDYMIYLLLDALFGIIPLILILTKTVTYIIPSLICILISLASVAALIIFEGKNMYEELDRRLHL